MITDEIAAILRENADEAYRDFQMKLIPTVPAERSIGVRTPFLRALAKDLYGREDIGEFLDALPHEYFDEDQLHAFIISLIRDFDECLGRVETFLPYVNNWATCDQLSPKVFSSHREALLPAVRKWISSGETYTVRFGIGMLMSHFLDGDFDPAYLQWAADAESGEYYVNMMRAWYFATALAKQYDAVIGLIEAGELDTWTHNMTIRKAAESRRITAEQKQYLRSLKKR